MSKRGIFVITLFLLSIIAHADIASTQIEVTEDSDRAETSRTLIGAKWTPGRTLGVLTGRYSLKDPVYGSRRFTEARGIFGSKNVNGFVGRLHNSQQDFTIGQMIISKNVNSKWYIEAGVEHNIVDTILAVDRGITFDSYSVAADYTFSPGKTIVGHIAYQEFSDHNNRDIYTVKYIHKLTDNLSLQFGRKNQQGDFNPSEYWSPGSREIMAIGFIYYQSLLDGKWAMKLNTNGGPQKIENLHGRFGEMKFEIWGSIGNDTRVSLQHVRIYSDDGFYSYKWNYSGLVVDYTF